jgi:hypothetical protein
MKMPRNRVRADEVPADFVSDGCTAAPNWMLATGCLLCACRVHDWRYFVGGDEEARLDADLQLREDIAGSRGFGLTAKWRARAVAEIYYQAVRVFGSRHFRYK